MDYYTWTHKFWLTSKNLRYCHLEDLSKRWPIETVDERVSKEFVLSARFSNVDDDNDERLL